MDSQAFRWNMSAVSLLQSGEYSDHIKVINHNNNKIVFMMKEMFTHRFGDKGAVYSLTQVSSQLSLAWLGLAWLGLAQLSSRWACMSAFTEICNPDLT